MLAFIKDSRGYTLEAKEVTLHLSKLEEAKSLVRF